MGIGRAEQSRVAAVALADMAHSLTEALAAGEAIIAINEDQRIALFSRGAEATFGYRAAEILGQPVDALLPERFRAALREHIRAFAASGEFSRQMDTRRPIAGRRKDGTEFPTEASIVRIARDGAMTFAVILRDITERQRADEALREANEALSAVFSISPVAIWALDRDGNITMWNPAAETLFGWSRDEVLGRPIPFVPEDKRDEFRQLFERSMRGETARGVEVRCRRRDGGLIDLSLSTAPLQGATGAVVAGISVAVDITARKQLEHELQQAQKMDAIGRLAGGIAHDFNNVLTVIGGRAQMLLERLSADDVNRRDVNLICQAAERAATLVHRLLAFGRRQTLQPRVVNLNGIIHDLLPMLRRLIGEDVKLVSRLDSAVGSISADSGQIEQVIMNLAVNARDAMPRGGQLVLETHPVDVDEGFARQHPECRAGPAVMLRVSDTGTGMDAETLRRIFEPFFTTKLAGKGAGLGLAMVYGIVTQHGGAIEVKSVPAQGTTFEIYFPQVEAAVPETVYTAPLGGTETILLVEDEDEVRELSRAVLEGQGYTVLVARDGTDGLRIAEQHGGPNPLLLVTDVVMPELSGPELVRLVQARNPGAQVLYVSGYTDDATRLHGLLQGRPFLAKPFSPAQLLQKVREVLEHPACRSGHKDRRRRGRTSRTS
jgi:PAS domain S-box-containing protein